MRTRIMKRTHKKVLVFGVILALVFLNVFLPRVGLAGAGKVDRSGDRFLLTLNVMFAYRETNLAPWKTLFQQASDLLYNATEGQMAIDTINIFNCGHAKDLADIWVLESSTQLPNVPFANTNGLGSKGRHIILFKDQLQKGPFGIVHELGHYVFGLYDEYRGQHRQGSCSGPPLESNWPASSDFFCTSPKATKACIMGVSGTQSSSRTEFCTAPGDNFPGTRHATCQSVSGRFAQNAQDALKNGACWMTLTSFGLRKPSQEPSSTLPPNAPQVKFHEVQDLSRVVLVIDRSGSMAAQQKMDRAKEGAKIFVDLLHQKPDPLLRGDELAIVSFSGSVSVDFPLQEIISDSTRMQARTKIDILSPNGPTAILDAVQTAVDILRPGGSSQPDVGCGDVIILLSDGIENSSRHKIEEVVKNLETSGVRLFSIGLGKPEIFECDKCDPNATEGVCTCLLKKLAVGGLYQYAPSADELPKIFAELSRTLREEGLLTQLAKNVKRGDTTPTEVIVESNSNEATFSVIWQGLANLDVTLTDPNGFTITRATAATDPNIEFFSGQNVQYYRVKQPTPGRWQINTRLVSGPSELNFIAQATSDTSQVNVVATMSQDEYFFPQQMKIKVQVDAGYPVAGANVTGRVRRPDGNTVNIVLFDDGRREHGDEFADDGVYSALFSDYAGNGTYSFDITVRNEIGRTIANLPFVETDASGFTPSMPVGPFVRQTTVTAILKDQPRFDVTATDRRTGNSIEYQVTARSQSGQCFIPLLSSFVFTTPTGEKFIGSAFNVPILFTDVSITLLVVGFPPDQLFGQITITPLGALCNLNLRTADGRQFGLNATGRWKGCP